MPRPIKEVLQAFADYLYEISDKPPFSEITRDNPLSKAREAYESGRKNQDAPDYFDKILKPWIQLFIYDDNITMDLISVPFLIKTVGYAELMGSNNCLIIQGMAANDTSILQTTGNRMQDFKLGADGDLVKPLQQNLATFYQEISEYLGTESSDDPLVNKTRDWFLSEMGCSDKTSVIAAANRANEIVSLAPRRTGVSEFSPLQRQTLAFIGGMFFVEHHVQRNMQCLTMHFIATAYLAYSSTIIARNQASRILTRCWCFGAERQPLVVNENLNENSDPVARPQNN
jgi:hypothetical protein